MGVVSAFAQTFQVTHFDVMYGIIVLLFTFGMYYFWPLQRVYSIAFGAIMGIGIYVLLSVLLLGNGPIGSHGGLLSFKASVVVISIAVYAVFILAVLFPARGGLIISETSNQFLYILQYLFVGIYLIFSLTAVMIYMVEQTYIFQVGTIFTWFRDSIYYQQVIQPSALYTYVMSHQDIIIPLGVLLILYKIFFSNIISAIVLSIVYNLSHMSWYRRGDDKAYRVEFHEVGASGGHTDAADDTHTNGDHGESHSTAHH